MGLIERRIGLLFAAFFALLAIGAARAVYLATIKGSTLRRAATEQQASDVKVPAPRGTITDRHGVDLAVSEPADDVAADPLLIKEPLTVAQQIAAPLGQSPDRVLQKLSQRDRGFVYLARNLPSVRARGIERLKIEGIDTIPSSRRTYPQGWLASQLLGTVGTDGDGLAGLEYSQDRRCAAATASAGWSRTRSGSRSRCATERPARPGATSS